MQKATEIIATDVIGAQPVICIGRKTDQFKILVQVVIGCKVWPRKSRGVGDEHNDKADQGQTIAEQSPEGVAPQTSMARSRRLKFSRKNFVSDLL